MKATRCVWFLVQVCVSVLVGGPWALAAEQTDPAPAKTALARPPSLGITVDLVSDPLAASPGVHVARVQPGSNAATLKMLPGDVITAIDEQPVLSSDDLKKILQAKKHGEAVRITVQRERTADDGQQQQQAVTLAGVLKAPLGLASMQERVAAMTRQVQSLKHGDPAARPRYTLEELLIILRQIERDLPAAAAEFKQVYPKGRFKIGIHIDIDSHHEEEAETGGQAAESTESPE